MKRQTAANNAFLREQKSRKNHLIYKRLLAIVNAEGEDAGRVYLQQFVRTTTELDAVWQPAAAVDLNDKKSLNSPPPTKWFRPLDPEKIERAAAAIRYGNGAKRDAASLIARATRHVGDNPYDDRETAVALAVALGVVRDANDMEIPGVIGTGSAEFQVRDRAAAKRFDKVMAERDPAPTKKTRRSR